MIKNGTKRIWKNVINEKAIKQQPAYDVYLVFLLIMVDTLLLRTSLHFTTLHYTCRHFTSSRLNFTQLHFTTLSFGLTPFKFPTAPFHLTSQHFTSLHLTFRWFSPHYSFHFTPCIIAFLTLFLKILGLQGKVPNASAGSWFQFLMVLFTKEYFPISVLCFLSLIFHTRSALLK